MVIVTLVLACALIATVSAADENGVVRSDATETQLKLINELWGKDITVLEYMETVHPEHLVGVSDSIKKSLDGQKMKWWGNEPASAGEIADGVVEKDRATVTVTAIGYTVDWRTIYLSGTTYSNDIAQPWYIYADASLINRDTGQTIASTSASSQAGIRQITAWQNKLYPANGQYYVHAWGYIPTPYYAEDADDTAVFNFP